MRLAQYIRLIEATRPLPTWADTAASIATTQRLIAQMDRETLAARNSNQMGDR